MTSKSVETIAERVHAQFEARTLARDRALSHARALTRHCANAIRAIQRAEVTPALEHLDGAQQLVNELRANLDVYPDLYYAGYTQDALKEYAEACLVYALIFNHDLPTPDDLNLEPATYMQGLAETVGEMRRACLDAMLNKNSVEAARLMAHMDDVYTLLVTMDYPDAITGGLRRLTDLARGIVERTRGDLTISLRQERLEESLRRLEDRLENRDASE